MPNSHRRRSRTRAATMLSLVILIGVASRTGGGRWPGWVAKDLGDVLWATMFYLLAILIWPGMPRWAAALAAMGAASGIECLKLYDAPWIERMRTMPVLGFLLGRRFLWGNFVAYAAGVIAGVVADRAWVRRPSRG